MDIDHGGRPFGRIVSPLDARDYALTNFIAEPLLEIGKFIFGPRQVWDCDRVLDQGATSHCVGFAGADFGNCLPVDSEQSNADGDKLYYTAKQWDANPEGEDGTTIRNGAKALRQLGHIQAYAFAHSINEVATWIQHRGPVIVGTNWYRGMLQTDSNGYVHVQGEPVGGHAWLVIGFDFTSPLNRYFIGLNSWGEAWGQNGRFKISANDLAELLKQGGEAVTAVEIPATIKAVDDAAITEMTR